jgi:hypothetical protein
MQGGETPTLNRATLALCCVAVAAAPLHSSFWTSKLCNNQYPLDGLSWPCVRDSRVVDSIDGGT